MRSLAPGSSLVLTGHAECDRWRRERGEDAARFLVSRVEHRARNNLESELATGIEGLLGRLDLPLVNVSPDGDRHSLIAAQHTRPAGEGAAEAGADEETFYTNRIEAIPAATPWRPLTRDGHGLRLLPKPTVDGLQSAIVVGLAGEPITTERDHRIKIQFHWQRGARSHARQSHPSGDDNAPGDERAGTWVRVATPLAGNDWGGVFVPRLGQEVLIAFLAGDIDRPVVIGALYNGRGQDDAQGNRIGAGAGTASGNAPAWFPGSAGAHAHNAVLAGIKTQALAQSQSGTGGYNQLVFDDTPGEARATLASTEHASQLNLGHLKHQHDNERRQSRGHGAELLTQGYGALRAGAGLLLSADVRQQGAGSQLDSREAAAQIEESRRLAHALAEAAQKHLAKLDAEPAADKLAAIAELDHSLGALRATASGSGSAVTGDATSIGGGQGSVTAYADPLLLSSAPAGIAVLTPADAVLAAGRTLSLSAGQDLDLLAQADAVWAVKEGIVLFTYGKATDANKPNRETGIRLHAASGQASVQAHSDRIEASADKTMTVASTTQAIQVAAPQHVLLTSAGAYVKLEGANIQIHAPGTVQFKAGQKNLTGPQSASASLDLPKPSELKGCDLKGKSAAAAGEAFCDF